MNVPYTQRETPDEDMVPIEVLEYLDIIDLPHPTSKHHPRMSQAMRAAQFSPFAALTRFGETIAQVRADHDRDFDKDLHCADPEHEGELYE